MWTIQESNEIACTEFELIASLSHGYSSFEKRDNGCHRLLAEEPHLKKHTLKRRSTSSNCERYPQVLGVNIAEL